jgi:exosortase
VRLIMLNQLARPLVGTWRGGPTRGAWLAVLTGLMLAALWAPFSRLAWFVFQHEHYSHIILVPLITASLFLRDRKRLLAHVETHWLAGGGLVLAGALLALCGEQYAASASENDRLAITIFGGVVIWVGAFVLCYGLRALRVGLFPVLFLFLMVPIPDLFLSRVVAWLQAGSAEVSDAVFQMVGVPVFRTGFIFSLPGLTIEVSKECSGIRSSLAMLIMTLLAGHLCLRSAWTKAVLIVATLPVLIVKNGIRIVTLSLLSIYVDPGFITGSLHRRGGIVFFLVAFVILAPVLWLLQRAEEAGSTTQ